MKKVIIKISDSFVTKSIEVSMSDKEYNKLKDLIDDSYEFTIVSVKEK